MSDTQLLEHQAQRHEFPKVRGTHDGGPECPLTGSQNIQVLEEFPTSLLVDCYQRDLGINVASEFLGVQRMQLCRCLESNLIFFYPSVTGSTEFYKQLRAFDWYSPTGKFEYKRAADWIKPGNRVLEIGCGTGQFAITIPDASYTGLEPNIVSEAHSKDMGTRILSEEVIWHAMTYSQTYDVVCAFQVLEHIGDPETFLTAALACLKPDGLLILEVRTYLRFVASNTIGLPRIPPVHGPNPELTVGIGLQGSKGFRRS